MRVPAIATKVPQVAIAEQRMRLKQKDVARLREAVAKLEARKDEHVQALTALKEETDKACSQFEDSIGAIRKAFTVCSNNGTLSA